MAAFTQGYQQLPDPTTSAAVTARKLVQRHTDGAIRLAVADSDVVGVTLEGGASGSAPKIAALVNGTILDIDCTTANAVAVGDRLTSAAGGFAATTTTAGEVVVAIALSAKAAATAGSVRAQINTTVVPS